MTDDPSQPKTNKPASPDADDRSNNATAPPDRRTWTQRTRWIAAAVAILVVAALAAVVFSSDLLSPSEPSEPSQHPPERTPGSEWLREYAQMGRTLGGSRHRFVLEQVAEGNMPDTWDDWVTVTVTGRKGTVVSFEVSPHGLRIGTNEDWVEVPVDGPHFAAAAELLGVRLATAWMVKQIHKEAHATGKVVHYFAATEIARSLGYANWNPDKPDGAKMKSAEFFKERSQLLREWLDKHGVEEGVLISGYFKSVVPPIDGVTRAGGLEMIGGYTDAGDRVQPLSGGFHERTFYDYSHNTRFTKETLRVNDRPMTIAEFFYNVDYATEFGFRRSSVPDPAYKYTDDLVTWMQDRADADAGP